MMYLSRHERPELRKLALVSTRLIVSDQMISPDDAMRFFRPLLADPDPDIADGARREAASYGETTDGRAVADDDVILALRGLLGELN
jgi:hypothetical protein